MHMICFCLVSGVLYLPPLQLLLREQQTDLDEHIPKPALSFFHTRLPCHPLCCRVRFIVSGGAPLAPHVEDFCNVCMAPLLQVRQCVCVVGHAAGVSKAWLRVCRMLHVCCCVVCLCCVGAGLHVLRSFSVSVVCLDDAGLRGCCARCLLPAGAGCWHLWTGLVWRVL